jgi:hypothetical protein
MAADVALWARDVRAILDHHRPSPGTPRDDRERRTILDALGESFGRYRARAFPQGAVTEESVPAADLLELCRVALAHLDHTIGISRRADGLYHAYHVLRATGGEALAIEPLYEMLEGQVAAMSSGAMAPAEAASLVQAMFESPMYDPVRRSFMLYPERELPGFLEKNAVPAARARSIGLLRDMLAAGDASIVALDSSGTCRFHPDLAQARLLAGRLDALGARGGWADRVARDRQAVLDLYEEVFRHRAFTGRSGTMYGYEGLGCIYWHMVAKLLLAVQEQALRAVRDGDAAAPALARAYDRIRGGLGFEKTPGEFGAFPTDPYSHTPRHAGARQPGMTGQVKEEILTRLGELGVRVEEGAVHFRPVLLERAEFLAGPEPFRFRDVSGRSIELAVPARALAFTFCQVPVLYHLGGDEAWVRVTGRDGASSVQPGDGLDAGVSRALFDRRGDVSRIDVGVPERTLSFR